MWESWKSALHKLFDLSAKLLPWLCWILSQRAKVLKMCQSVVKKCHTCLMNKLLVSNTLFLPKNLDFSNDLRTFVAKFFCWNLCIFFLNFFVTETQAPQTFSLLECKYSNKPWNNHLIGLIVLWPKDFNLSYILICVNRRQLIHTNCQRQKYHKPSILFLWLL